LLSFYFYMTTQSKIFKILNRWARVIETCVETLESRSSCPCSSVVPARLWPLRHFSALGRQRETLLPATLLMSFLLWDANVELYPAAVLTCCLHFTTHANSAHGSLVVLLNSIFLVTSLTPTLRKVQLVLLWGPKTQTNHVNWTQLHYYLQYI
jgi:hypothetical protein